MFSGAGSDERRLWLAVVVAVAALFLSLYPLQFALDFLRARNLLRITVASVFLACAAAVAAWARRRQIGIRGWTILAVSAGGYAVIALSLDVPQERLHLVEYGVLALLLRAALASRQERSRAAPPRRRARHGFPFAALASASGIGLVDEIVQGILPNRQYDLRDVVFNAVAALLALTTWSVLGRATSGGEK